MGRAAAVIILAFVIGCFTGYKFTKSKTVVVKPPEVAEEKAVAATEEAKQKDKIIYRDVIKYVQNPNRTVCRFDDESVRLRQQAVDSANSISGFDETAVQGKQRWYQQR